MPATADTVADTMPSAAFLLWLAYWNTEAVQSPDVRLRRAFGTNVNVLTQFAGTFVPSKKCPAPRVLLYLCGHVRTWNITAASHFQMLERSSPGCWFVVAALPHTMTQQRAAIPKTVNSKYWAHQLKQAVPQDPSQHHPGLLQGKALHGDHPRNTLHTAGAR